jgi:hypothetical protein
MSARIEDIAIVPLATPTGDRKFRPAGRCGGEKRELLSGPLSAGLAKPCGHDGA